VPNLVKCECRLNRPSARGQGSEGLFGGIGSSSAHSRIRADAQTTKFAPSASSRYAFQMLIRSVILFFFLLTPLSALAQDRAFDCLASGKLTKAQAQDLVNSVQSAYSSVSSMEAQFLQSSYLQALDVSELSSGVMKFLKPGKMRWDYEEPEKQSFVVKDSTVYLYQPDQNQMVIDQFSSVVLSDLPVGFIMGIGDLSKSFTIGSACKGPDGTILEMSPAAKPGGKKDDSLKGFKLLVNPSSSMPSGALITDVGGNITSILFREMKINPKLDSTAFTLKVPKGTDVVDRREE
jgi:outer membrane lipoprotein carrier protein